MASRVGKVISIRSVFTGRNIELVDGFALPVGSLWQMMTSTSFLRKNRSVL